MSGLGLLMGVSLEETALPWWDCVLRHDWTVERPSG